MTTPNASALTLETVAEHFAQWRDHKTRGETIPEALWREAIALLDRYRISQVVRTLRLSGSDLNKRRQQFAAVPPTVPKARQRHAFAEMAIPLTQQAGAQTTTTRLEFQRPDGLCLRIHSVEGAELLALVDRFIGGGAC